MFYVAKIVGTMSEDLFIGIRYFYILVLQAYMTPKATARIFYELFYAIISSLTSLSL